MLQLKWLLLLQRAVDLSYVFCFGVPLSRLTLDLACTVAILRQVTAFTSFRCVEGNHLFSRSDRALCSYPAPDCLKRFLFGSPRFVPSWVTKEILELGPHGVLSEFIQSASREIQKATWGAITECSRDSELPMDTCWMTPGQTRSGPRFI